MKNFQKKLNNFEPLVVLCIGDSTTSQEWCHPNWVDWITFVLKQEPEWPKGLNRKIINQGIDGSDIEYFLENFETSIAMYKPDITIMSLGFNNIKEFSNLKSRASKLLEKIQEINSDIVIWSQYETPNPKWSSTLENFNNTYKELSEEFNTIFIDIYNEFKKYDLNKLFTYICPWGNSEWDMKPGDRDYLHCNEIGNQIIAEKILKEVFNTGLSIAEEWKGMGTMIPKNLDDYR